MSYVVEVDAAAQPAVDALPYTAAVACAEVFALLELAPYRGAPINPELTPDGPLRTIAFGAAGMLTYLIIEHAYRVDVLRVTWVG